MHCKLPIPKTIGKLMLGKVKLLIIIMTKARIKLGKILGSDAQSCFREALGELVEAAS